MQVYVIDMDGQPLMPTTRFGKVRRMLDNNEARVISRCPFTIRLMYRTETRVIQPVEVGDDAGSKDNGLSAVAVYPSGREKEVYASEVEMRNDIVGLLSARRQNRRSRRSRKTRYREPKFDNRVRSKHKGWLAPSIENKIHTHIRELEFICSILPVTKITVETASFDIQKLKADLASLKRPQGKDYQQGEQSGFWNAREYVLFRDGHKCRCCNGRSSDPVLEVHHIESRQTGGDAPHNLVTLCRTCHEAYHAGRITLPSDIRRGASFRDAAFMGIMRWSFFNRIRESLEARGIEVKMTYGYITKQVRISHGLEKTHCVDARCISGHPDAETLGYYYAKRKVRCHNRQIYKSRTSKGGVRKRNQAPHVVKGFRLFDCVTAKGRIWYIHGRRSKGSFVLKNIAGEQLETAPSRIRFLSHQYGIITERRMALLPAL